jgi:ketosteroid isomerase-like protein
MKTAILALTALFVAAAPLAWGQEDATPAPAATPEVTAPEKSQSPADPSVSVTTEKTATPAPSKSSSPAATKSSSPAAKSSPSASTKTSASPAPVTSTKKMSPEATIRDSENRWEAATMTHDTSVAVALLGDDYAGVNSKGKLMSKRSLIAEIKKDKDTYTSAKNGRMDVRIYGGHFAVVTGTSSETGKDKDGKAFSRAFRWTDVWVDRNGNWSCVASQANLVAK